MTFQKNNAHDAPSAARYHKAEVRNGAAQIVVIDGLRFVGSVRTVRIRISNEIQSRTMVG